MKLNVTACVYPPQKFSQTGGDNPPIAEFRGEYELNVDDPVTLGKAFRSLVSIADWEFLVAGYDPKLNMLTLKTNALGTDIPEVLEFVISKFGQLPGWTVHRDRLIARIKPV